MASNIYKRACLASFLFGLFLSLFTAVPALSDYAAIRSAVITNYAGQEIGLWFDDDYSPPASSNSIHASLIDGRTPYFETTGIPRRYECATVNSMRALDYYNRVSFSTDYSLRPGLRLELWLHQFPWDRGDLWSLGWWVTGSSSSRWVSVSAPMMSEWQFRVVAVPEPSSSLTLLICCVVLAIRQFHALSRRAT